jgi:hypothetical protein
VGTRGNFPDVKKPGHEADHSTPSSAEVKNVAAIPVLPYMSTWHSASLINHRDNFISLEYSEVMSAELFFFQCILMYMSFF